MEDHVSSANLLNLRKPLPWLIAVAAGAALFASGALVARATLDDGDVPASPDSSSKVIAPGIGADGIANSARPANYGPGDVAMTTDGGRGASPASYPGCQGPLPAGVIVNGVIDPSKAGFVPALPSSGFTATSISLSVQGKCDATGAANSGDLVLSSSWKHTASGLDAYISQMASSEKIASVFRQDGATFWANGYVFNVNVSPYRMLPMDTPATAPSAGAGTSGSGAAGSPVKPGAPQADPRAAEVLRELIGQIAPGLDQKCFWTQSAGDWSSLATVGVGDPRPAIPAGYTQTDLNVIALVAPASGCDTSLKPTDGFNFNAGWQKNANGADFGYLGISVYSNRAPGDYPGQLSEYGANWSNGSLSFSVYAKSEKPIGTEAIRAIAKALDPSFNEACFIQDRALAESELAGLGFHAAKAPDGYQLNRSSLRVQDIAAGCTRPDGFQSSYNLNWNFQKGADVINASANRYDGNNRGDGSGFQSANSLNWTSTEGVSYSVNAYSTGISPMVPKDDLIAVAKSMDPAFDISKLTEGGPEKPIGIPMPVEDKGR